ncbi:two-component SAPR family response regulator [Paenibacillus castaneae]|uniref:response regulator n=1 Tax=Paenibacillus castaneae TaxID=474957 RepID=UPI000C9D193A|nr:response regulator [Paenibacillus castaneae]NIK78523.1 two-component SAPR family response regulator [Paenibacillus castaneae]
MFRAVIIEDEKPILDLMKVIIGRNANYRIVGAFTNPIEALEKLEEIKPDVAFVDVEMPKMNGVELSQNIRKLSIKTEIVFTTAYKDYALEAFGVEALDYILKPVTPSAVQRVAERLINRHQSAAPIKSKKRLSAIRCFGGFEVRNAEDAVIRLRTRKTEELFAYFLCHPGRVVSKWQLADLLWSEMDEERVSHNLHNSIYLLKKMLREYRFGMDIIKTNDGYLLETGDEEYDLLAFQRSKNDFLDDKLSIAEVDRLCSLYSGPLLDGKPYLWKVSMEEGFGKQYTAFMRQLIQAEIAAHNWSMAEQRLDTYLNVYPLEEEMNSLLMDVYESQGKKELIVRHYAKFEAAYLSELGIKPSSEIRNRVDSYFNKTRK